MKEPSLFDFPQYQINKKIRLIELFGGIGSQAMALRDLGADFENYRLVEIDKHAVKVYNAIHNTSFTPADIKDVKGVDLGTERERSIVIFSLILSPAPICQLRARWAECQKTIGKTAIVQEAGYCGK
jgi:hypothetical protein